MNGDGKYPMDAGSPEESGWRFDQRLSAAKVVLSAGDSWEEDLIRSRLSLPRLYRWIRIAGLGMKYGSAGLFREARFMLIGSAGQEGMARAEAVQVAAGTVSPSYVSEMAKRGSMLSRFFNRKANKLEGAEATPS